MKKSLLIIIFSLSIQAQEFLPFLGTTRGNNLLNTLVAYWSFEENNTGNAFDSSTNSKTLTANTAVFTSPTPGIVGLTRELSASDDTDYFYRASEGPLTFNTNTAFTITSWAHFSVGGGAITDDMTVVGKADISVTNNCSWWLALDHGSPTDKISFFYSNSGELLDFLGHHLDWDLGGAVDVNIYYFIAVRWTGTLLHLSVTPETLAAPAADVTVAFAGPFYNSSTINFTLGTITGDTIHDMGGNIDEVGIWSRYLSDYQITKLFSARNGNFAYPQFDSNTCTP